MLHCQFPQAVSRGCPAGLRICWDSSNVNFFLGQRVELRVCLGLRELKKFSLLLKTLGGKLPGVWAFQWANSRSGPVVRSSQGLLGIQASAFCSFPKCVRY